MRTARKCFFLALAALLMLSAAGLARKTPETSARELDSGAFGVFVNGQRVATERFHIQQRRDLTVDTSEFKVEEGQKSAQRAELQISSAGELVRYEWKEVTGKASAVVEPAEQFLVEHMVPDPPARPQDKPFLMPHSTIVLDDYFFSHREILLWRYLAQNCANPKPGCNLATSQFGTLVPQQLTSAIMTVAYGGKEKVLIHGAERELDKFTIQGEDSLWLVWLDSNYKIVRILIPADNTEVVRE